jgi:hypothetical protein
MTLGIQLMPILKLFPNTDKIPFRPSRVLETKQFSFKQIIQHIEKQDFYYAIHVKNTGYNIGSKSSKSRGVINFNN